MCTYVKYLILKVVGFFFLQSEAWEKKLDNFDHRLLERVLACIFVK